MKIIVNFLHNLHCIRINEAPTYMHVHYYTTLCVYFLQALISSVPSVTVSVQEGQRSSG